eukprot:TRINITY_DN25433_c0_g2_i1.p1 TRINITY_DN25433_c0_g2~~TRINITY_DN25433_c0_g2_i1.p1  ORF type:complete len:1196 (+),score=350.22 TRINITY_DN25433_c0_g2_i1:55-3588(+)
MDGGHVDLESLLGRGGGGLYSGALGGGLYTKAAKQPPARVTKTRAPAAPASLPPLQAAASAPALHAAAPAPQRPPAQAFATPPPLAPVVRGSASVPELVSVGACEGASWPASPSWEHNPRAGAHALRHLRGLLQDSNTNRKDAGAKPLRRRQAAEKLPPLREQLGMDTPSPSAGSRSPTVRNREQANQQKWKAKRLEQQQRELHKQHQLVTSQAAKLEAMQEQLALMRHVRLVEKVGNTDDVNKADLLRQQLDAMRRRSGETPSPPPHRYSPAKPRQLRKQRKKGKPGGAFLDAGRGQRTSPTSRRPPPLLESPDSAKEQSTTPSLASPALAVALDFSPEVCSANASPIAAEASDMVSPHDGPPSLVGAEEEGVQTQADASGVEPLAVSAAATGEEAPERGALRPPSVPFMRATGRSVGECPMWGFDVPLRATGGQSQQAAAAAEQPAAQASLEKDEPASPAFPRASLLPYPKAITRATAPAPWRPEPRAVVAKSLEERQEPASKPVEEETTFDFEDLLPWARRSAPAAAEATAEDAATAWRQAMGSPYQRRREAAQAREAEWRRAKQQAEDEEREHNLARQAKLLEQQKQEERLAERRQLEAEREALRLRVVEAEMKETGDAAGGAAVENAEPSAAATSLERYLARCPADGGDAAIPEANAASTPAASALGAPPAAPLDALEEESPAPMHAASPVAAARSPPSPLAADIIDAPVAPLLSPAHASALGSPSASAVESPKAAAVLQSQAASPASKSPLCSPSSALDNDRGLPVAVYVRGHKAAKPARLRHDRNAQTLRASDAAKRSLWLQVDLSGAPSFVLGAEACELLWGEEGAPLEAVMATDLLLAFERSAGCGHEDVVLRFSSAAAREAVMNLIAEYKKPKVAEAEAAAAAAAAAAEAEKGDVSPGAAAVSVADLLRAAAALEEEAAELEQLASAKAASGSAPAGDAEAAVAAAPAASAPAEAGAPETGNEASGQQLLERLSPKASASGPALASEAPVDELCVAVAEAGGENDVAAHAPDLGDAAALRQLVGWDDVGRPAGSAAEEPRVAFSTSQRDFGSRGDSDARVSRSTWGLGRATSERFLGDYLGGLTDLALDAACREEADEEGSLECDVRGAWDDLAGASVSSWTYRFDGAAADPAQPGEGEESTASHEADVAGTSSDGSDGNVEAAAWL